MVLFPFLPTLYLPTALSSHEARSCAFPLDCNLCVPNLVLAAGLPIAFEGTSGLISFMLHDSKGSVQQLFSPFSAPRDSLTRHPSQIGDDMIFWDVSGLRLIVPGSFVISCLISIKPVVGPYPTPAVEPVTSVCSVFSCDGGRSFYRASAKYCGKECQFTAWSEVHLFWCSTKEDDDAARAAAAGDAATGAGIPVVQAQAGPSDPSQGHVRWAERAGDGWEVVKGVSHVTPRVEYGSPVYSISIFCSTKQ
ncbi:hypothetical protein FPV67DRAFT_1453757 [Lyophyllum atratum]|nr:hypothetical protein FPV67DRAFT_1453757 [Lyophyllum atratum]